MYSQNKYIGPQIELPDIQQHKKGLHKGLKRIEFLFPFFVERKYYNLQNHYTDVH